MFAVTGITGQVGGEVARALLEAGERVRAVVRHEDKGAAWAAYGCEVAVVADATDRAGLAAALAGTSGTFLMVPPDYDPAPGFPAARTMVAAYAGALADARPGRVVALSSIGAQIDRFNLLNNAGLLEQDLVNPGVPIAFLRPAWFIENAAWDVAAAREGAIDSFLQPTDRAIDMVSVRDIGRVAAELLRGDLQERRVVELRGPRKVSPDDLAAAFSEALGRPVQAVPVARATWEARFRAEGMRHPQARMAMLDGFNEGWIEFAGEGAGIEPAVGTVDMAEVVSDLCARS
ncbi:NmrA family NAD(P)-binding protein [Sphingomonas melonis]|jgi:NAD(P)H dehydrogenase (quinone)|uniref:NAD(P)H-binding protein n=1 Tax=Sphingomonas naphthae TaxID=1813468 RepID=A0ABY7TRD3_9SPHN|nr:NmrA family NAD(P)-binding protein [Sphingomonas naphthae]WCT75561.1 NAD(P)H-binding protein [Sphingomonas naphthae]